MTKFLKFAAIVLMGLSSAYSPAFATGTEPPKGGDTIYNQHWDNSVHNNNKNTNNNHLSNEQKQQQAQAQQQAMEQAQRQGQGQVATGGAGGNALVNNGINIQNKNYTIVAPSIQGTADSNSVSLGTIFGSGGFQLPTKVYKTGQIVQVLVQIKHDRPAQYMYCQFREAYSYLMLNGIRCDLLNKNKINELIAYEQSLVPVVVAPAPVVVAKAPSRPKPSVRRVSTPITGPIPTPAPPRQTNGKAGCIEVRTLICPATQGLF